MHVCDAVEMLKQTVETYFKELHKHLFAEIEDTHITCGGVKPAGSCKANLYTLILDVTKTNLQKFVYLPTPVTRNT
jgi:hypothetical protein